MFKIFGSVVVTALTLLSSSAFAFPCDTVVKDASEHYMAEKMGMACIDPHAVIIYFHTTKSESGTMDEASYWVDVTCGSSVYNHTVVVKKGSCVIVSGGPEDA